MTTIKLCGCVVGTMALLVLVAAGAIFYPQWAYQVDQLVVEKKLLSSDAPIYRVGEQVISDSDIVMTDQAISIEGEANPISLPTDNPYADMT